MFFSKLQTIVLKRMVQITILNPILKLKLIFFKVKSIHDFVFGINLVFKQNFRILYKVIKTIL